ncbi:hypothetical protein C0J52_10566 [Blattella germanica]|nr:hypothetical protein C0J52_10566 [Blattella germanica]
MIIHKADISGNAHGDTGNNIQQYSFKLAAKVLADACPFSVEERLVASVWVHERRHIRQTMEDIQNDFVV